MSKLRVSRERAQYALAMALAAARHDPVERKLMLTGVCRRARWSGLFTSGEVNRMRERACMIGSRRTVTYTTVRNGKLVPK